MDRKAWIILSICGLLLALNFYYKPEPPQPAPITNQPEASDTNNISETTKNGNVDDVVSTPKGKLFNEAPVPAVGENIETLTSKDKDGNNVVEFAISSSGGGIKTATLVDQFAVGSNTEKVVLNMHSPATIGSICDGPDDFADLYYTIVKDNGSIYCEATTPEGLKITKKWSLDQESDQPGAQWTINLTITLTNNGQARVQLSNFSLYAGSAPGLYRS
jgi:YidC/Oxa1 family membrane protein insertase